MTAVADQPPRGQISNPLDRVGDVLSDLAIWGLAFWTAVYHAGRAAGIGADVLLLVSTILTLAVALTTWRHLSPAPGGSESGITRSSGALALPAVVLTVAAVVVQRANRPSLYALGWSLAVLATIPLVWLVVTRDRSGPVGADDSAAGRESPANSAPVQSLATRDWTIGGLVGSVGVWLAAMALSYASLRTVRLDADDVFYVNKAVFVAENGMIPLRDTIYSNQVLPALRGAGTAPVQSIEVLQGAIAHALGLSAGTVVYLLTPVVMSFLAVWAVWRLVRSWSRQRAVVAFVVAIAYLMWGVKGYGLGAFFIGRIWQGKAIFVCLAIPLIYLGLTTWARHHRRYDAAMLLALGAAAVGLTSTATLVVPPIALAVALAMLLAGFRHWWGAVLPAVYPVVSGAVVAASDAGGGEFGAVAFTSSKAFHYVVGTGLWGALGLVAILLAPWVVRRGPGRVVAAAGSLAALVVMAPGMPELANRFTGAGPILYRLMWVPALPVLVGVLATAAWRPDRAASRVPAPARQALAVAVPVALLTIIVVGGTWFWAPEAVHFAKGPTWKYNHKALVQARWIDKAFNGPGTVLAPWRVMRGIALSTTEIHAVDPRSFYLSALSEPPDVHAARIALSASMKNGNTPPPATLGRDLELLDVGYVCLDEPKKKATASLTALGWTVHATGYGLTCYQDVG